MKAQLRTVPQAPIGQVVPVAAVVEDWLALLWVWAWRLDQESVSAKQQNLPDPLLFFAWINPSLQLAYW